jgi:NAD+ kinase
MVGVELSINGAAVSMLQGDGLIVATATGSTGYSLSCGGPILCPEEEVIVLAPLAAHTLAIRPMVAPSTDVVQVRVSARHADACVIADGQVPISMRDGDSAEVRTAPFKFKLFEGPGWSFYRVLREKLRWGEEPNYAKGSN